MVKKIFSKAPVEDKIKWFRYILSEKDSTKPLPDIISNAWNSLGNPLGLNTWRKSIGLEIALGREEFMKRAEKLLNDFLKKSISNDNKDSGWKLRPGDVVECITEEHLCLSKGDRLVVKGPNAKGNLYVKCRAGEHGIPTSPAYYSREFSLILKGSQM